MTEEELRAQTDKFRERYANGESLDEMLASFNADEAMRIRREGRIVNITKR